MLLSNQQIQLFREAVWAHYRDNARTMPWRANPTPYNVLVSELMLQQTQVNRVLPKFEQFIAKFPSFEALGAATLAQVLAAWSGLGYNRRAKYLHQTAQKIVHDYAGKLPETEKDLVSLPGIGKNTAGAILAYVYNKPVVFIETNIRTVYIHHFFTEVQQVSDTELAELARQTVDHENPREWYWALMDYGTYLKQSAGNNIAQSRHYSKQSKFIGSKRQIRGQIIKLLLVQPQSVSELELSLPDERTKFVIEELVQEQLITRYGTQLRLTDGRELP